MRHSQNCSTKIQRTIPKTCSMAQFRQRLFENANFPTFSLSPSLSSFETFLPSSSPRRDETRREEKESRLTSRQKKKKKNEKVDSNMFRVFLNRASLSEGGKERQGRSDEEWKHRKWRDGELVVRHATRTQSHFHKFSQVLRQLVPSNSRRTVSPFPSRAPTALYLLLPGRAAPFFPSPNGPRPNGG